MVKQTIALGIAALLFSCTPVHAQDEFSGYTPTPVPPPQGPGDFGFKHQLNHDWYKDLRRDTDNYPCCNGSSDGVMGDCRPTFARTDENGNITALIDGKWEPVPKETVLDPKKNKEWGMAHVCASWPERKIYCFLGKRTGG
jgi:hypothetical protein